MALDETDPQDTPERVEARRLIAADRFRAALDSHGYGFQYAVLEFAKNALSAEHTEWVFEVGEFPAEVQGTGTRIDLVLGHRNRDRLLLGECKRANPAVANWCFVRAPYRYRNQMQIHEPYRVDGLLKIGKTGEPQPRVIAHDPEPYHIGLEVDTGQKGDARGAGGKEIEQAVTQVLRGVNGFVNYALKNPTVVPSDRVALIPVVFTTASLWVSDLELQRSALDTGRLAEADSSFRRIGWVRYQYNSSPGLLHAGSTSNNAKTLSEALEQQFIRSVAIVSPSGLHAFLQWSSRLTFFENM